MSLFPVIRRATEADLKNIYAIESAVQESPWLEAVFSDFQADDEVYFFVVEGASGKPEAFIIAVSGDDFLEILNFAVAPLAQGQGTGSLLFKFVLNEAAKSGIKTVRLEVRESNSRAIAIYKKNGLKVVGIRKGYYNDNSEDALLMTGKISFA